jgi:hypothetical protein
VDDLYRNIRDLKEIGELIGQRVLDITQNDPDDPDGWFVEFFFEDGTSLRFPVSERGFDIR